MTKFIHFAYSQTICSVYQAWLHQLSIAVRCPGHERSNPHPQQLHSPIQSFHLLLLCPHSITCPLHVRKHLLALNPTHSAGTFPLVKNRSLPRRFSMLAILACLDLLHCVREVSFTWSKPQNTTTVQNCGMEETWEVERWWGTSWLEIEFISPVTSPGFSYPGSHSICQKEYSVESWVVCPGEWMHIHTNTKQL